MEANPVALVDFTDPANAYEVAWMDPDPLDPPSDTSPGGRTNFRGGDWSSYGYNGLIYESDTRRGLYVCRLTDGSQPSGPRGPVTPVRAARGTLRLAIEEEGD